MYFGRCERFDERGADTSGESVGHRGGRTALGTIGRQNHRVYAPMNIHR